MFRKRAAEMLRRGLSSLDELDVAEEKERLDQAATEQVTESLEVPPLDSDLLAAVSDFNPSNPFWADLGFLGVATSASSPSLLGQWGAISRNELLSVS